MVFPLNIKMNVLLNLNQKAIPSLIRLLMMYLNSSIKMIKNNENVSTYKRKEQLFQLVFKKMD